MRATLADGQVLMGTVRTETLRLETGFGTVDIPLEDIGEVQPVEGGSLGGSDNHVSVWLRNGSELRGAWTGPALTVGLRIDERLVDVDIPMDRLERLQLQSGDLLPAGIVHRVRTIYGDDFVVDADATWVRLDSDLGRFTPTLGEVWRLDQDTAGEPPQWRMELQTGTVLIGALAGAGADPEALTMALPLGPATLAVPIDDIRSIERQDWGGYEGFRSASWGDDPIGPAAEELEPGGEVTVPAVDSGVWFDNRRQLDFKSRR